MDNRITKNRLANFFMYHWITFLAVALIVIFFWELIYTMFEVKLTTGQRFKYFYDQNIAYVNDEGVERILDEKNTFSYDVILSDYELLNEEYNTLNARLILKEGDAIFTDDYRGEDGNALSRARHIVDTEKVINFEKLLENGKAYLVGFLKNEYSEKSAEEKEKIALDYSKFYDNYDLEKIRQTFINRNGKDNRFRKNDAKEKGVLDEIKRIEKLSKEISDFDYLLKNASEELFFRYTKFSQAVEFSDEKNVVSIKDYKESEIKNGRENVIYGLNVEKLTGGEGKKNTKDYFRLRDFSTSYKVVVMAFDFTSDQPDLQYETVSFINTLVRTFSDLYDNR